MEMKDIIEIIINGLCAVATVAAVIVALWQTKYSTRKKLKLKATEVMASTDMNNFTRFLQIKASNVGNRKITIVNWSVMFNKKDGFQIVDITKNTSFAIDVDESINLSFSLKILRNVLKQEATKKDYKLDKKLMIVLQDNSGKEYKVKALRSYAKYMNIVDSELNMRVQ